MSGPPAVDILYEDDCLLAVSKPPGIVSHPCYKHADGTVYDALLAHLGDAAGVHPRLLQRLDKGTSGVMLASKTMAAHAGVIRAMRRGAAGGMTKEYLAVVHGVPEPASGEIALRLRRAPTDSRRVAASEADGKESLTRYRVIGVAQRDARDSCDAAESGRPNAESRSLVLCEPLTGRMHQIRVHLAARGWPIVGDPAYGPDAERRLEASATWTSVSASEPDACATEFPRQALHAWRVSLAHPVTGARLVVTAPLPPDMAGLLCGLGLSFQP